MLRLLIVASNGSPPRGWGKLKAAVNFARTEGFLPAPEPAHAIKAVIDAALKCRESGEAKVIVLAFSGHGHFDLAAYDEYLSGRMQDYELPEEEIQEALKELPKVGGQAV